MDDRVNSYASAGQSPARGPALKELKRARLLTIAIPVVWVVVSLVSDSTPLAFLGVLIGAGITVPVILRHPLVMPLTSADAEMMRHVNAAETDLRQAGRRYEGDPSRTAYASSLEAIRRRLRKVQAPDDEWAALLVRIDEEIAGAISQASGQGADTGFREKRDAIRRQYQALITPRIRFWR